MKKKLECQVSKAGRLEKKNKEITLFVTWASEARRCFLEKIALFPHKDKQILSQIIHSRSF